jgi:hypothetical protein
MQHFDFNKYTVSCMAKQLVLERSVLPALESRLGWCLPSCCCRHVWVQAFDSPSYPPLAELGIDVAWNRRYLMKVEGQYTPR